MKQSTFLLTATALLAITATSHAQTVSIASSDTSLAETAPGQPANPAAIQFTRSGPVTAPLTVWVKVSGTALQNIDYRFGSPVGSFVTLPAGVAQLNVPVTAIDDALIETAETIRVELDDETSSGAPVPYTMGTDRVDLTLADNEDPLAPPLPIVTVAPFDPQAAESPANPAVFRLSRTNNLTVAFNVSYSLGGTATAGTDYVAPPPVIAFPPGALFVDVPIAPINDSLVEPVETIVFTLLPAPGTYAFGPTTNATAHLTSEDLPPPPVVAITSPAPGFNVTSPAATPVSIPITFTASDSNGHIASYIIYDGGRVVTRGTATYPEPPAPGTPFTTTFTMPNAYGGTHQLRMVVTDNSGITASSAVVAATVTYDYPTMSVTALDASAAEKAAGEEPDPAVFVISVDAPMPIDQHVFYRLTSPGPAIDFALPAGYSLNNWPIHIFTGPTDYGVAVFPAGTTSIEIPVTPLDDLHLEGEETLTLELSYPFVITERTFEGIVQYTQGGFHVDPNAIPVVNFQYEISITPTATATIADNDTQPAPFSIVSLSVSDSDAAETAPGTPANPGAFTITRDGPTNRPLTVLYALTTPPRPTVITTQVAVAQNGIDFAPLSGVATIPTGATSVEIPIAPIHDLLVEPGELVQISLRPSPVAVPDPASYIFGATAVASLTILDATLPAGTPVVRVSVSDSQAYEGAAPSRAASFLVHRTGDLALPLTVAYAIGGTATNGTDYSALPGTIEIPAGSASAAVLINPIADGLTEDIESVALTLQAPLATDPPTYVLGATTSIQRSGGVTIRDTYTPPLDRFQRALRLRYPGRYAVVQRPPLPAETAAATAEAPAALTAPPSAWNVEASPDLVHWEQIGTVQPGESTDEFVDLDAHNHPQRFYRFVPVPAAQP
jgi:hypothetical protein